MEEVMMMKDRGWMNAQAVLSVCPCRLCVCKRHSKAAVGSKVVKERARLSSSWGIFKSRLGSRASFLGSHKHKAANPILGGVLKKRRKEKKVRSN